MRRVYRSDRRPPVPFHGCLRPADAASDLRRALLSPYQQASSHEPVAPSPPRLHTEVFSSGYGAIILCAGTLNETTKGSLLAPIRAALSDGHLYVLLDLGLLSFSDDSVLKVLQSAQAIASRKGVKLEMIAGEAVDRILRRLEGRDG